MPKEVPLGQPLRDFVRRQRVYLLPPSADNPPIQNLLHTLVLDPGDTFYNFLDNYPEPPLGKRLGSGINTLFLGNYCQNF